MAATAGGAKPSVIVTGGGTGIGFSIATRFARGGYGVSIVGRRASVLAESATALAESGADVLPIAQDLAAEDGAARIVAAHVQRFGGLTSLVSAAGIYEQAHFLDLTPAAWDRVLGINLRGTMCIALETARFLAAHGGGRIILVGSVLGQASEPVTAAYSVSKAGVASLARSMAIDLAKHHIGVNCIAPGWVRTPMAAADIDAVAAESMQIINPLGRAAEPEEIADVAWYLVHEAPAFLTGQTITVDGGQLSRSATL